MAAIVEQQEGPAAATGTASASASPYLATNHIHCGDTRLLLPRVQSESVALSFWSPPYFVGKPYEAHLTYADWCALLETTVRLHFPGRRTRRLSRYQHRRHPLLSRSGDAQNPSRYREPEAPQGDS